MRVALVSRDDCVRAEMARAFDGAPPQWRVSLHAKPPAGADVVVAGPDVHVPGAVQFDPRRPEATVAAVTRARPVRRTTVAVTATTGGAGATTVALHLAAEVARRRRTVVVDFDPLSGAHGRLGLDPGPTGAPLPAGPGFRLLRPPAGDPGITLQEAASDFDFLVADVPHGLPAIGDLLAVAGTAVLVVAPTPVGARRAAAIVEPGRGMRWAVVVNRVGPGGETTVRDVERALGRRVAVELPCCPALRDAEDDDRLLSGTWGRWLRRIRMLAGALSRS